MDHSQLIIAAQRPGQLLVHEPNIDFDDPFAKGRIYDVSSRTLSPDMNIQSIAAQGYWEPYAGDDKKLSNQGSLEGTQP